MGPCQGSLAVAADQFQEHPSGGPTQHGRSRPGRSEYGLDLTPAGHIRARFAGDHDAAESGVGQNAVAAVRSHSCAAGRRAGVVRCRDHEARRFIGQAVLPDLCPDRVAWPTGVFTKTAPEKSNSVKRIGCSSPIVGRGVEAGPKDTGECHIFPAGSS